MEERPRLVTAGYERRRSQSVNVTPMMLSHPIKMKVSLLNKVLIPLKYSLHLAFFPSHFPVALHVRVDEPRSLNGGLHVYVTTLLNERPLLNFGREVLDLVRASHCKSIEHSSLLRFYIVGFKSYFEMYCTCMFYRLLITYK